MHEIDSRDLEEAWPDLGLKLAELHVRLPPLEATVFEAIVRAAAEDTVLSDAPELPPDLTENNQPQRDGLTRLLLGAIAQLPSQLGLDQATEGRFPGTSGAASEMTARPLVQKLATIATNEAEREGVKILLGTAASSLARGLERSSDLSAPQALPIVMETLLLLQPHYERIPPDGTVWRGRPSFLTKDWLDDLQADAAEARGRAIQLKWRALARAGPVAKQLAISQTLIDLVESHAGSCESTARAAYVYYDSPGHGVYPHVDASSYALTALFMVRHDYCHAPQSHHLHFLAVRDASASRLPKANSAFVTPHRNESTRVSVPGWRGRYDGDPGRPVPSRTPGAGSPGVWPALEAAAFQRKPKDPCGRGGRFIAATSPLTSQLDDEYDCAASWVDGRKNSAGGAFPDLPSLPSGNQYVRWEPVCSVTDRPESARHSIGLDLRLEQ